MAKLLINHMALANYRNIPDSSCSVMPTMAMQLGSYALHFDEAMANSYLSRIEHISGQFPCTTYVEIAELGIPFDSEWGNFILRDPEFDEYTLPHWLSKWSWSRQWPLVGSTAMAAVEKFPSQLFGYYYLAQSLLNIGDVNAALDVYLSAVSLFPDSALLHREIARIYHYRLGDLEQALTWYKAALTIEPDESTAKLGLFLISENKVNLAADVNTLFQTANNSYAITRSIKDLPLKGYILDEDLFALSQGVDVELYNLWRVADVEMVSNGEIFDDMGVVRERTLNMAPNPRFDWDQGAIDATLPLGYLDLRQDALLEDHALSANSRNKQDTICGQLSNVNTDRTGFYTLPIAVQSDGCYLETGWINSENGGNAYIGYQWLDVGVQKLGYGYVASGIQDVDWSHYAGLVNPITGTYSVRLRLLNNLSTGTVCFDDIIFIPVGCYRKGVN